MLKRFLLAALLLALFGCGSKTSQTSPSGNAPYWVSECDVPSQWYCGSGKNNAEAMRNMVEQMRVKVNSKTEQVTNIAGKDAQLNYKQKINISTGDIEVAGVTFYSSPSGTVYVSVRKEDLADFYGHKIIKVISFADLELERAEADTEEGNTKLALKRINAIKDTLENNFDSWVTILHAAGGRGSENASEKKRELLLLADGINREICRTAKLHWNSGQYGTYSDIAFSKLSSNKLKMEKAGCKDRGVSLNFKNEEPRCSYIHGLYKCSCRISLSIASCEGVEHLLLENSAEGVHNKENFALEKMQNNLRNASFWEKWKQEVKEWVPQCVN
jgi:hypothetical protein